MPKKSYTKVKARRQALQLKARKGLINAPNGDYVTEQSFRALPGASASAYQMHIAGAQKGR